MTADFNDEISPLKSSWINSRCKRSTLADANEKRNWRIYADLAQKLIARARQLYQGNDDTEIELNNIVYALDSTTIDLCLDVFWWAKFRKHKAAIKLHTLLDVRCEIPCFIHVSEVQSMMSTYWIS